MLDNLLVAEEVIHTMQRKKGKISLMAIKLDLNKACDRLKWSFIQNTLTNRGILDSMVSLTGLPASDECMDEDQPKPSQELFLPITIA